MQTAFDGGGSPPGRAAGFPDWLPGEAARRQAVLAGLLADFAAWGYELVGTPLVEPLSTVAGGTGAGHDDLFRFTDSDGRLLALVGERTASVARVMATQLRAAALPQRLCYAGEVLRNRPLLGGRRRAALQAGCELIGSRELAADAECVALATQTLDHAGLDGVQVDIGHAAFLPGLLEDAGLHALQRQRVLAALRDRDLVAVEEALEGTSVAHVERSLLLRFPALRGGGDLLELAAQDLQAPRARLALSELSVLWDMLEAHGVAGQAQIDLGAVADWDYYTGPTFEIFSGDLGFPLGSGGRYDRLLSRFGLDVAATGFVLHVDRCCDALQRTRGAADRARCLRVSHAPGAAADAYELARRLRSAGLPAACSPSPADRLAADDDVHLDGQGAAHWSGGSGTQDAAVAALLVASLGARHGVR